MIELSDNELILITQLSDENGYTKSDLETLKVPDVAPNTLRKILYRLEKGFKDLGNIPGKLFFFGDITDPYLLTMKLLCGKDPFSRFIQKQMDGKTKDLLNKCDEDIELRHILESTLDNLAKSIEFYNEPHLLAKIKISQKTGNEMKKKPNGEMNYGLNKMILEDAYPNEIAKSRKPIIYKGLPQGLGKIGGGEKYYLYENLSVFRLIIREFDTKIKLIKIKEKKMDINIQNIKLIFDKEINAKNSRKFEDSFESWKKSAWKLNEMYESFLKSYYIIELFKRFGFSAVYDIMKSMEAEDSKIWLIIELAHEQNIISDEDFLKRRTIKEMLESNSDLKL